MFFFQLKNLLDERDNGNSRFNTHSPSDTREMGIHPPFSLETAERIVPTEYDVFDRVSTTDTMLMGFEMINCRVNGRVEN